MMEKNVTLYLRVPKRLKDAIEDRAIREKRTANTEAQAMLEWALRHMPEQLAEANDDSPR